MKAGFVGLGKLGLPVSVAMTLYGKHEIFGYDLDVLKRSRYRQGIAGVCEPDIDNQLKSALRSGLHIVHNIAEATEESDIVFVAVQTPSLPDNSFDTSYLVSAIADIGSSIINIERKIVVSVISTVLPMTMRQEVAPVLEESSGKKIGKEVGLCYNPSFIAMGTTVQDLIYPEFLLIGESDTESGRVVEDFYKQIFSSTDRIAHLAASGLYDMPSPEVPICHMTWENAEIVKMAYNTYIGAKIVIANTLMELCHKIPYADVDVVSKTLSLATRRIVGSKYMRGGMGDGGACHPRDNLALSWLAQKLGLSADPFNFVMNARTAQTEWLADLLQETKLPIVIMGERFKPNTDLTDYSASLLLADILRQRGEEPSVYDPITKPVEFKIITTPSAFLIALDEPWVKEYSYPAGSVVVDPWRCLDAETLAKKNVTYIPIGRH